MQNLPVGGFPNPQLGAQQQQRVSVVSQQNQPLNQHASQGSQALPQYMIQQLLQDFSGNNGTGQQKTFGGPNMNPNLSINGMGYGNNGAPATPAASSNVTGGGGPSVLSKSNSFKAGSNSDSSAAGGGFNQKAPEVLPNLQMTDDIVPELPHDYTENGFFGSDLDDNMGFGWK